MRMTAFDPSVSVYLDGEEVKAWSSFDDAEGWCEYTFFTLGHGMMTKRLQGSIAWNQTPDLIAVHRAGERSCWTQTGKDPIG